MSEISGSWKVLSIGNMLVNFGVAILAIGLLFLQGTSVTISQREKKLKILLWVSTGIVFVGIVTQICALF